MSTVRVLFERSRRGRETELAPPRVAPVTTRPSRAAQMLAQAHEMQALIDRGEVPDRTALAMQLGFTRARVTQLLHLLLLAPDIQEDILFMEVERGRDRIHEHCLRGVVATPLWSEQRERWRVIKDLKFGSSAACGR